MYTCKYYYKLTHLFTYVTDPEVPAEIEVDYISPTEVVLSWNQPHRGRIEEYALEIVPNEGQISIPLVEDNFKKRLYENLTPGISFF